MTISQGAATTTTHYVYGLDGEVAAEWENAPAAGPARQFVVADHLGSTRVRFDANGDVLQRIDYEPYGVEVQRSGVSGYTGSNEQRAKYTGKDRVPEVSADYFHARWLGMGLGRFTTPDGPLVDQQVEDARSWNLYGYVRNNPLFGIDPDGRSCVKVQTRDADGNLIDSAADDGDGKGCAAAGVNPITSSNSPPGSDIIAHGVETKAQADKELTQAERQEISLIFRDLLGNSTGLANLGDPPPVGPVIMAVPPKRPSPRINGSICFIAPAFFLENQAIFGVTANSRPSDSLLGGGPGPYWQPTGRSKNGGYGPVGASREKTVGNVSGFTTYLSNALKCRAVLNGNQ